MVYPVKLEPETSSSHIEHYFNLESGPEVINRGSYMSAHVY